VRDLEANNRVSVAVSPSASAAAALARYSILAAGTAAAVWLLSHADLEGAFRLVSRAPWLALLLPATYALAASLDVLGFRILLAGRGVTPRLSWLLRFRLMSDALTFSIPSGTVMAEGLNYAGLTRTHGLGHRATLIVLVWRRLLVACAHATVALCGAWAGRDFLARISPLRDLGSWMQPNRLQIAILMLAIGILIAAGLRKSRGRLVDVSMGPGRGVGAFVLFMASWIAEALDTYLVLWVLGAGLPFLAVISFEGLLSLVRSLAVFVPAGLGVQDAGYMLVLQGLGVPGALALGTAFLLLKRSRELALVVLGWIGVGREFRALSPAPSLS
jgi:hypothetical protein